MSARVLSIVESKYRATLDEQEHDEFSCGCCGAGLLEDGMCCPDCEAHGCGEQDKGTPCLAKEAQRHAENERKAKLYDAAMSDLGNAIARLSELTAAREEAGKVMERAA